MATCAVYLEGLQEREYTRSFIFETILLFKER